MISILIPTYNRESIIGETIESALAQTYEDLEIIITDNASTDATWNIIEEYSAKHKNIRAFRNEENLGPVRNWKRCIDEAQGEFAKILWSDDLIHPEFLQRTIGYLEQDPEIGFVISGTEVFIDEPSYDTTPSNVHYQVGKSGIFNSEYYIEDALFENHFPFSPGCALFRTDDLRKNLLVNVPNKVDIDFSNHAIGNDLLIFLLTANAYSKFAVVADTLAYFREHKSSISNKAEKGKLHLHYALAKAYFVENVDQSTELVRRMNVQLWWLCWLFKENNYQLKSVEDFYMQNSDYRLSKTALLKKMFQLMTLKKIKRFAAHLSS